MGLLLGDILDHSDIKVKFIFEAKTDKRFFKIRGKRWDSNQKHLFSKKRFLPGAVKTVVKSRPLSLSIIAYKWMTGKLKFKS